VADDSKGKLLSEDKDTFTWQTPDGSSITTPKLLSPSIYNYLKSQPSEPSKPDSLDSAQKSVDDKFASEFPQQPSQPDIEPWKVNLDGEDPAASPAAPADPSNLYNQTMNDAMPATPGAPAPGSPAGFQGTQVPQGQVQLDGNGQPQQGWQVGPGGKMVNMAGGQPVPAVQGAPGAPGAPAPAAGPGATGVPGDIQGEQMLGADGQPVPPTPGAGKLAGGGGGPRGGSMMMAGGIGGGRMTQQDSQTQTAEQAGPEAQAAYAREQAAVSGLEGAITAGDKAEHAAKLEGDQEVLKTQVQDYVDNQRKQEELVKQVNNRLTDYHTAMDNFSKSNKINPNRLFGDGETGNKILAAIALAFGGIGGGLAGRDFNVVGIIQKAIERDIDVQKANIDNLKSDSEMKRGALQEALAVGKDMREASAAEYTRLMNIAKTHADSILNSPKYADQMARAHALQVAAPIYDATTKAAEGLSHTVTTNTMSASMQPLPEAEKGIHDKYMDAVEKASLVDRIQDLAKYTDTGFVANNIDKVRAKFGMQNADAATLRLEGQRLLAKVIDESAGARGWSPGEIDNIAKMVPTMKDRPDVFTAKLNEMRKGAWDTIRAERAASSGRYYLPDAAQVYQAYRGTNDPNKYTADYFQGKKTAKTAGK
jgi:hypothetical protein